MKQLNAIEIETVWGFKSFELLLGDITRLDTPVDLLAVSVFANDYGPLPGTVVGALYLNHGIRLDRLLSNCAFDLRSALCCWVSEELSNLLFSRILCVELLDRGFSVEEVLQNVFVVLSMLEAKGVPIRTFALPLLGTGNVDLDLALVIRTLLHCALDHLRRSESLQRIQFVTHNERSASALRQAMDETLGRVKVVLPRSERANAIRREVLGNLGTMEVEAAHQTTLFTDLRQVVSDQDSRSWQFGIGARKLLEFVVDDILGATKQATLARKLDEVKKSTEPKIADWILQYMQVLREMGNETAHEDDDAGRVPAALEECDLELCLLCLNRLLSFWLAHKEQLRTAQEAPAKAT